MSNPYFYIAAGTTSPTLDAVLLDGNGQVANLQSATVQFTLADLGGDERFTRSGSVVSASGGHVRYSWQPGDLPGPTGTRYLGYFTVTFSSSEMQDFPSDRYIEIHIT